MSKVNQKKLALLAGVSVSTVSKAFSGSHEISEETRDSIFALAKRYGCFDKYCRVRYQKRTVAVIAPEFSSNVYTSGIGILERQLRDRGCVMLAAFYNFSDSVLEQLISYFAEYVKVDGIIVLSGEAKNIPETGVPIIHYKERQNFNPRVDTFSSECKSAVGLAIEYLKETGHRDIAFIGELLTNTKLEYFLDAMREQGLKADDSFIRTSHSRCEEAGFSEMEKLLSLNRRPTAIMCAYDTIAFGAIDAIKQHGLRVPEDFSIIGMNDVKTAVYSGIGLTTVREVPDEVFSMMTDLLCKRMDGSNVPRQAVTLHGELIKRQSVAKR